MSSVGTATQSSDWSVSAESSADQLQVRKDRVAAMVEEFDITDHYRKHLDTLLGYDIVILCDDSRSMKGARWESLKETVKLVMRLATAFDEDGIDLFAFGRDEERNVVDDADVEQWFDGVPSNRGTPLVTRIEAIVREYLNNEKPVLLLVATDGEPNDGGSSAEGRRRFTKFMRGRESSEYKLKQFPINFLLFNERQSIVDYYSEIDKAYTNVDVTNSYDTERRQVREHNPNHPFTRGDWIVKMLLGSIVEEIDDLDERRVKPAPTATDPEGCCTIL